MSKLVGLSTNQIHTWTGEFGRQYTDRNTYSPPELDELYLRNYGVSRTQINQQFLNDIPRTARVLEVGCNIGTQLLMLQQMGFTNLHGIEIQSYALDIANARALGAVVTRGSALAIPYSDGEFDFVFTSGVLIHIAPNDLLTAMREIHRCTKKWIWGLEYYAPQMTEVEYRGHKNLLWKTDYAAMYLKTFTDLRMVREQRLRYLESENVDTVFLLQRK